MSDCTHHWKIDEPKGATSLGRCLRCGAVREYNNSLDEKRTWRNKMTAVSRKKRQEERSRIEAELARLEEIDRANEGALV